MDRHRAAPHPRAADGHARSPRRCRDPQPRWRAGACAPATCCARGRPHPAPASCPDRAGLGASETAAPGARRLPRRAARRAARPGTASSRTTPGSSSRSPARPRRTAPRVRDPGPRRSRRPARGATMRDELTGATHAVRARSVVNAAGVWAGELVDRVWLRPSRGTHLVLRADRLPGVRRGGLRCPCPARSTASSFVAAAARRAGLRRPHRRARRRRRSRTCRRPSESEVDFLLETVSSAFDRPLTRDDVVGAYAGLRPLLDAPSGGRDRRPLPQARRADLRDRASSRRRRQADDLPADGAGHRRRAGLRSPDRAAPRPPAGRRAEGSWTRPPGSCVGSGRSADQVLATGRRSPASDADLTAPVAEECP